MWLGTILPILCEKGISITRLNEPIISGMMTFEKVTPNDSKLQRVIDIYLSAFPQEERRELENIEWQLANNECYNMYAIRHEGEVVGMFVYWDFEATVYIEYLAMDATLRGGGLGTKALTQMIELIGPRKVIFEVELPENEIATRRIEFYKRFNFQLWDQIPYEQPPYRATDDWFPMHLMTNGEEPNAEDIALLHQRVYNVAPSE